MPEVELKEYPAKRWTPLKSHPQNGSGHAQPPEGVGWLVEAWQLYVREMF